MDRGAYEDQLEEDEGDVISKQNEEKVSQRIIPPPKKSKDRVAKSKQGFKDGSSFEYERSKIGEVEEMGAPWK